MVADFRHNFPRYLCQIKIDALLLWVLSFEKFTVAKNIEGGVLPWRAGTRKYI